MTPKQEAALRLALEALTHLQPTALTSFYTIGDRDKAITAIREVLAQPEQECFYCGGKNGDHGSRCPTQQQEPVAKVCHDLDGHIGWNPKLTQLPDEGTSLYIFSQPSKPLTDGQRKAIVVCFTSGKVSVSEVQRKLAISYNEAQQLCQSIVDLGLAEGLQLAPSLDRHGIKGDA